MIKAILGQKQGQTQRFTSTGERIPVTMIMAGPCTVVWANDSFLQIAYGEIKKGKKAILGHVKKAGLTKAPLFLAEVDIDQTEGADKFKPGDKIQVASVFKAGDIVDVTGISKGKGFSGVVKRWGFKGGPRTHGQSDRERAPGSIGQTTTPGRVYKGKKMAGRDGGDRVTIKNLSVVEVDAAQNLIYVKGLVPGAEQGKLLIKKVGEGKTSQAQVEPQEQVVETQGETK